MNTREYHNNFFKKYGLEVHDDPERFKKIAELCKGETLDLACGTGTLSKYYKGPYTGIDISDIAINLAKKNRRDDTTFYRKDAVGHKISLDKKFDTIVITELLEHLLTENYLFKNLKKLSHKKTKWVISTPNSDRVPDENHRRTFTVPELRKKFEQYGRVKFQNYTGFEFRIILTVELDKKPKRDLGLAMIVKNEQKGLEHAILSCIDIVDEIVISVDENSGDKTDKIASNYADTLKHHQWNNNFAEARNYIQKYATTKWVLILDGHEFVKEHKNLDQVLKKDNDGLFVKIELEDGFKFLFPRIIRQEVIWEKAVHNNPKVKNAVKYEEFKIQHDRIGNQALKAIKIRAEQREKMIPEIMTEEIKENPKSARPHFYLGQFSYVRKEFKKAIKYYKKYLKLSDNTEEMWMVGIQIAGAYNFLSTKKRIPILKTIYQLKALRCLWEADKLRPGRWEIKKALGLLYAQAGWYKKAIDRLIESFEIQKGNFLYQPIERNDATTWDTIGNCFLNLNQKNEALTAWQRAIEIHEDPKRESLPPQRAKILKQLISYQEND